MAFPGPTWTSSHVYGQGLVNHASRLSYFNTPKCASMWMRAYLAKFDNAWVSANFTQQDMIGYCPIVLVRDPVERWVSMCPGVDEMPGIVKRESSIDRIFANFRDWTQDEHTTPQYDFIDGLDLTDAVYFWCDKNLSGNVKHFFDSIGFPDIDPPAPVNEQPKTEQFKESSDIWRTILSTPKYLEQFKQTFKRDYDLINQIKFYGHN